MGLNHPRDLQAWHRWQASRKPLRRAAAVLRGAVGAQPETFVLESPERPTVLICHDSWSPTSRMALLEAAELLSCEHVAHLHRGDRTLTAHSQHRVTLTPHGPAPLPEPLQSLRVVVALGHYMGVGGLGHHWACEADARFLTVQHGLLAPHIAPLAAGTLLLAWSEADAAFWASGRSDVETRVTGSQLLHNAAAHPATVTDERPVFLGQLHGAELPRCGLARATWQFCSATGASYRPHPSERDKVSRLYHRAWQRKGLTIEHGGAPLTELDRPVASVFSTGVLEAAARGLPAWVHHPAPPAWLEAFWSRYGMARWAGSADTSTPAPSTGTERPTQAVANVIQEVAA